jgi:hypothetical protein
VTLPRDFWAKVDKNGPEATHSVTGKAIGQCWQWLGAVTSTGYGSWRRNDGGSSLPHRRTYEDARGPVPEGLELDHLCRNTSCCRPEHLEAVTHAVNTARGKAGHHMREKSERMTNCPDGHEYARTATGKKYCPTCNRIHTRVRRGIPAAEAISPELRPRFLGVGERNGNGKLTDAEWSRVREAVANGARPRDLARQLGVSRQAIMQRLKRDTAAGR